MDKITLTPRQESWLVKHFPNTKNDEIMAKLGLSHSTLHRMARQLGLKKTRQFISKCQAATTAAAKASHLRNGTYPPKGYIIPRSEEFRFKPGHTEKPSTKRKRLAKGAETLRQTIREERARVNFGFEQRTKLRLIRQPRRVICLRHNLKKRGYIVKRGSMVVYYDQNTARSERIESRVMGDKHYSAFIFKPAVL